MRVFISWSGDRSKAVAELLNEWIQCVLQAIRPWMSSKDIDRGSLWFSEITDQLKDTKIGIVCLTKDNLNKPWILFESGALAKGLSSSRVCTLLIDLEPTDVSNPLAQFNHTMPNKEGLYGLVRTLNSSLGDQSLRENVLEQVFETYWPQFETAFEKALENNPAGEHAPPRSEESMLSEMLRTIRSMDRRVRLIEQHSSRPGTTVLTKDDYISDGYMPRPWIMREIESLMESGVPPEVIERMLEGKASLGFIRRFLRAIGAKQLEEIESNSSSDEEG